MVESRIMCLIGCWREGMCWRWMWIEWSIIY